MHKTHREHVDALEREILLRDAKIRELVDMLGIVRKGRNEAYAGWANANARIKELEARHPGDDRRKE